MSIAVRSYLTAGMALVGVGVVTATQSVVPVQQAEMRVVERAVSLAAAVGGPCSSYHVDGCDIWAPQTYTPVTIDKTGSVLHIPGNIVNAVISVPRAALDGLNDLSYGLEQTGSWWVYTPTNVLGFDPADPPKVSGLLNLLIPFKPLSAPLGEGLTWWARANLPMSEACTATAGPTCPDLEGLLNIMFKQPINFLTNGMVFPKIYDPISELEGSMGNPLPADYPGNIDQEVPWSNAYVRLNPFDPEYAVINYLTADPKTNRPAPITLKEVTTSIKRFVKAMHLDFYPFVPMSFLLKGWPYTALTPLFKPFLPWLCPDCNPLNPAWPPGATEQPWPSAAVPAPGATESTAGGEISADTSAATVTAPAQPTAAPTRLALTGKAKRAAATAAKVAAAAEATAAPGSSGDPARAQVPATLADAPAAAAESGVTHHRAPRAERTGRGAAARAAAGSAQ